MQSAVITGFAVHAKYLAGLLNEHATGTRAFYYPDQRLTLFRAAFHTASADAAITFGGPRPAALIQRVCNARKRPAIVIWAGTDVTMLARDPGAVERLRLDNIVHWAVAQHLVDELAALGIEAALVPVASAPIPPKLTPMPREFTVLTYLPEPRRDFYGQQHVWRAARMLPDVKFVVVGRGERDPDAPPNVEYLGEVNDMEARVDGASVLLRLTQHDGLSLGVIEALARGRHVIWTYACPGVIHAHSSTEAIDALCTLRDAHRANVLGLNEAGLRYVAKEHDPATIARGVATALHDAVSDVERAQSIDTGMCRIAVSGEEVISARVAANCRQYSRRLALRVLNASSRSNTVFSALDLVTSRAWYTIGAPVAPAAFELAARISRKRRIIHWLGRDVDMLAENPKRVRAYMSRSYEHLAEDETVVERLRSLGLRARLVPLAMLPPQRDLRPLPDQFTLMLYASRSASFQAHAQYERLMQALRSESIRYIIVGGGQITVPRDVCAEHVEWRYDLGEVYDRSTALVRLVPSEFVSGMVNEALLHGRYVLCSNGAPFVAPVRTYEELELAVRALLQRHYEGTLEPQRETAANMSVRYAPDRCVALLAEACR